MIRYDVISKADIPPTPDAANHDRYGEWVAMARRFLLCGPDQAMRIRLDGMTHAAAISSLHTAGKKVGLKLSTMRDGDILYVTRLAIGEGNEKKPHPWTCQFCGTTGRTTRKIKACCEAEVCQKKRRKNNRLAYRARQKARAAK